MADAELTLWWYRALHQLVVDALYKNALGQSCRILDAGCGTGGLLLALRERGYCDLAGFDIFPGAVAACKERGLRVHEGDLRHLDHFAPAASADAIISNDTLYFFTAEERGRIVKLFARTLVPNGLLVLNVPALRMFRGIHDLSVGITHRFNKSEISPLLAAAGFDLLELRYWPFFAAPFICASRLFQRMQLRLGRDVQIRSDLDLPPVSVNAVLSFVTRSENKLLPWKPFGSSLFVVARKT